MAEATAAKLIRDLEVGDRIRPIGPDGRALKTPMVIHAIDRTNAPRLVLTMSYESSPHKCYPFTYRETVAIRVEGKADMPALEILRKVLTAPKPAPEPAQAEAQPEPKAKKTRKAKAAK